MFKPGGYSRRSMLRSLVGGSILMPAILSDVLHAAEREAVNPLAPHVPQFTPKAKRVIFMCMSGGASHVDTFDYKPKLIEHDGKKVGDVMAHGKKNSSLLRPQWEFKPRGQSGMMISELFPHLAGVADELCMINSMTTTHGNHFEATLGLHSGSFNFARPSIGSWVSYGLGTENQNLPSFVAIAPYLPYCGGLVWGSDFLPACHQGVRVVPSDEPIANMKRRAASSEMQELELGLIQSFNKKHLDTHGADPALAGRIKSYETAFGMQTQAPEAFDLSKESDETLKLYGLQRGTTKGFAWQCIVARRLAERGVRFIELIDSGANKNWDAHGDMNTHTPLAKNVDQPIAAMIKDMKARGMLDDTLIVWATEFGRTPFNEKPGAKGREHHREAFSCWLAGAGVKKGFTYGKTDELGIEVAENEVHVHDFHATILHLLGFDHEKFTFRHAGRDYRLTDVHGNVVKGLLS
jgi:hypothetical protein